MDSVIVAWLGIVVAGGLAGSFTIPSRGIRELSWNQSWLNCLLALGLLPIGLTAVLSPAVLEVIVSTPGKQVWAIFGFGLLWGVGSRCFSLAITYSGFAVANTLVCGIVACIGAAGPLVMGTGSLETKEVLPLLSGLLVLCSGILLCGFASHVREKGEGNLARKGHALLGVVLSILAGLFSSMINYSFAAGANMISELNKSGTHPALATLAVWVPALAGGFIVNAAFSLFLMIRAGETARYRTAPLSDWARGLSMGLIFFISLMLYGVSTAGLGSSGAVFGWATYMGMSIVASALWGFATDEWKQATRKARVLMKGGVALCVLAFAIFAVGKPNADSQEKKKQARTGTHRVPQEREQKFL